jgi:hypothetical protein
MVQASDWMIADVPYNASPLDGQIPIPYSTNTPTTHTSPHLLSSAMSSPIVSTSKNTIKIHGGRNSKGKQTAHHTHQAREATSFVFNERDFTVSVFVIVPHVLLLKFLSGGQEQEGSLPVSSRGSGEVPVLQHPRHLRGPLH